MVKYFYKCPLEAAFMAKHFGARLLYAYKEDRFADCEDWRDDIWKEGVYKNAVVGDDRTMWYFCNSGPTDFVDPGLEDYHNGALYIHPDSEHILEPQVGDVCRSDARLDTGFDDVILIEDKKEMVEFADIAGFRIIQRNGKAFHFPDKEE